MSSSENSPERAKQKIKPRRWRRRPRPKAKTSTASSSYAAPQNSERLLYNRRSIAAHLRHLENPALSRFFVAAKKVQSTSG